MTIVDSEEGAARPVVDLLEFGFNNVQDNGHSIFIVVPNNALVSISRIATHHAILLAGKLGRVVGLNESLDLLLLHLHVLLLLLHSHDEATVGRQLILALGLLHAARSRLSIVQPLVLVVRYGWLGVARLLVSLVLSAFARVLAGSEIGSLALTLIVCLILAVRVLRLLRIVGTVRLVPDARASPNLVDSGRRGVCLVLPVHRSAQLLILIALICNIVRRITGAASRHSLLILKIQLAGRMVLSVTVLLDQLLLLGQEQLLWALV